MTQMEGNNFIWHVTTWQRNWTWTRSKKRTQKEKHVVLVKKIPHFIYLYLPKIQTNSTYVLGTFSWVKTICNTFSYEHLNPVYATGPLCKMPYTKTVQAPIQKMDTTIAILVKNYTRYIYHTCHLVKWCSNSGKHLNSVWIALEKKSNSKGKKRKGA